MLHYLRPPGLIARLWVSFRSPWFILVLIAAGVLLRLLQYLANRSLWLDESMLALNIVGRSYAGLTKPLDYNQGAPIGFLLLVKVASQLFGQSEYALRLVPFVFGIVSLPLFYKVARDLLIPSAVPLAVALFAMLDPLVYYSSELKQYSGDVMSTLLLLAVAYPQSPSRRYSFPRALLLAMVGAATLWVSHAVVFLLAAIGIILLVPSLVRKPLGSGLSVLLVIGAWASSFAAFYRVSLRHLSADQSLLRYWSKSFMPLPASASTVRWLVDRLSGIFSNPAHFQPAGVAIFAFAVGSAVTFSRHRERFWLVISPLLLTLLASAFRKYPFGDRLLLFGVPLLIFFVAQGAAYVTDVTRGDAPAIGIILVGLLVFYPALGAVRGVFAPQLREEIKPVLSYVMLNRREGDILYLYYPARFAFEYYASLDNWRPPAVLGADVESDYASLGRDLNQLHERGRVWVIFSHVRDDAEKFSLYDLDQMGKRIDSFTAEGASVYLYDTRGAPPGTHSGRRP